MRDTADDQFAGGDGADCRAGCRRCGGFQQGLACGAGGDPGQRGQVGRLILLAVLDGGDPGLQQGGLILNRGNSPFDRS